MSLHVHRQQLDAGAQARDGAHQRLLDRGAQRRRAAQRPGRWHVHVQVHEAALAGHAAGDVVEAEGVRMAEVVQHGLHAREAVGVQGLVHQGVRGLVQQMHALAQHVERHQHRQQRVQPLPAGRHHTQQADDDAGRGPDVGDQVAGIALQRHRTRLAGLAQHREGQGPIQRRADDGEPDAQADGLQRLRVPPMLVGAPKDAEAGGNDQDALEAAGEVLRLVVAVGVLGIRRLGRERDHRQCEHGACKVDQRLQRIRRQADRPGPPPGSGLQRDGDEGGDDGELEIGAGLHGGIVVPGAGPVQGRLRGPFVSLFVSSS
mmetsp:Transcript_20377/g.78064  ORF Transcript_20377/g.78064 Transcript_20377/m.78064 type:complete len:317 (-) Transcript_20377:785-1735(-)